MSHVQTGFARTDDGIHLYYRSIGEGVPMVCCNGVGVSTFFFKYVAEHFQRRFKVILWDYRGHGRSGTPKEIPTADLTVERNARDLKCVLESADVDEGAILLGHSMGVQVILEFTKQFPDGVRGLIPMFGTFGRPLDTFLNFRQSRAIFKVISKMSNLGGRAGGRMLLPLYASPLAFRLGGMTGFVDKHYAGWPDINRYLEHLCHMDPRVFMRMVDLIADHDLEWFLPEITVPTLIIAGEKDLFTPLHRSHLMHDLIPESELIILAEASHAAIVEHPRTINRRIDRFLQERLGLA